MSIMLDEYVARGGRLHSQYACRGQWCVIHNPSDHHMREWPRILRESALVERRCPHGIGHPDPDSLAFFIRARGEEGEAMGVHGCDGCCRQPASNPLRHMSVSIVYEDSATTVTLQDGRVSVTGGPLAPGMLRRIIKFLTANA